MDGLKLNIVENKNGVLEVFTMDRVFTKMDLMIHVITSSEFKAKAFT